MDLLSKKKKSLVLLLFHLAVSVELCAHGDESEVMQIQVA